ncbi:hypothetical protein [Methanobrevibacter sp.]|uniref:hypothetical protein n=1 Tax=Methanobrevibacter sp. TaxID=66852 RepID=UPI00388D0A15
MKLHFENKIHVALISLVVFSLLVGISAISATDVNTNNTHDSGFFNDATFVHTNDPGIILNNGSFVMSVPYTAGTAYHWEVSPETHGADVSFDKFVADHPDCMGSSGTCYFNVHVNSDDYYVKLVLIGPNGEIVNQIDSDMVN